MPGPVIAPPEAPLILQTPAPVQVQRYARNGLVPNALYESDIASSLNFAAGVRTKQLFSGACPIAAIPPNQAATRVRWRFAAHTGPMLRKIWCRVLVARALVVIGGGTGGNPTVTLHLTNADGSTTYGSGSVSAGASTSTPLDTPDEFIYADIEISGVPVDTHVYGRLEDVDGGRLISACVYEESLPLTAANGYVVPSQCAATMPIYDARRQVAYELAAKLWKRGAAHLFNWTVDNQATPRTVSGSFANVIDGTSTTVSPSTPGYTIDLRYCRTRARSTVPCVFAAYAGLSPGGAAGAVWLVDSAGTALATIAVTGATAKWYTTTVDLPATLAKYDVHGAADSGETLSVGAVSLYQYAA